MIRLQTSIRTGKARRLLTLAALTGGALWAFAPPAAALTVSIPTATLPPLPVTVPSAVEVPPIHATVTVPGATSIDVQVSGVAVASPTAPKLPATVTIPGPVPLPPVAPPAAGSTATAVRESSPPPPVGALPAATPAPLFVATGAGAAAAPPRVAPLTAVITSPRPSTFLSRVPTIAAHLLLWGALAATALAMQMFVSSAIANRRRANANVC